MRAYNILGLVLLGACSLVNSTSDLRELDSGAADGGTLDAGPPMDVSADGNVVPDAGPVCPPPIARFEVDDPSIPRLAIDFEYPAAMDCSATVNLEEGGNDYVLTVEPGSTRLLFDYLGPWVSLTDDAGRMRDFEQEDGSTLSLQMPVERATTRGDGGVYDFEIGGSPTVDVSNGGAVVFSARALLPATSPERVYIWSPDGAIAPVHPVGMAGDFSNPKISDDGRLVAYVQTNTTGAGDANVVIRDFNSAPSAPVFLPGARTSELNHLDVRDDPDNAGMYFVLAHTEGGNRVGHFNEGESTSVELGAYDGGPGLLSVSDGFVRYAAMGDSGAFVVSQTTEGMAEMFELGCRLPSGPTMVSAYRTEGSMGFAFATNCDGTRALNVNGTTRRVDELQAMWGLADARPGMQLLRNDPERARQNGYRLEFGGMSYNVTLDGQGDDSVSNVAQHFAGAAISPNGEWVAYLLVSDDTMQVLRIPTR